MSESVGIVEEKSGGNRAVVLQKYLSSRKFYGKFEQKGDFYIESQLIEISGGHNEKSERGEYENQGTH